MEVRPLAARRATQGGRAPMGLLEGHGTGFCLLQVYKTNVWFWVCHAAVCGCLWEGIPTYVQVGLHYPNELPARLRGLSSHKTLARKSHPIFLNPNQKCIKPITAPESLRRNRSGYRFYRNMQLASSHPSRSTAPMCVGAIPRAQTAP